MTNKIKTIVELLHDLLIVSFMVLLTTALIFGLASIIWISFS